MAIPAGITTATITFGVPVSFTGGAVRSTVSIVPSASLVHVATGTPLVNFIEDVITSEGVSGQFVLPHTDQTGFQDESGNAYQNWYYTATISYSAGKVTLPSRTKTFQLPTGQTVVDLDLLPAGAPVLPWTAATANVTSFHGRIGAVTVQDSDLPTRLSDATLKDTFASVAGTLTPEKYGAVGDGVADDTAALNAALAASASTGKTLLANPNATYKVSQTGTKTFTTGTGSSVPGAPYCVQVPTGAKADFRGAKMTAASTFNGVILSNTQTTVAGDTITLKNVVIDGGGTVTDRGYPMVWIWGLTRSEIDGFRVTNTSYMAASISACTYSTFKNLTVDKVRGQGIMLGNGLSDLNTNCTFDNLMAYDISDFGTFSQPGNGYCIGAVGSNIGKIVNRNCAGGIKYLKGCDDLHTVYAEFDGTVAAGETDHKTANSGIKIQGDDASNKTGRVTFSKVVSRYCGGSGLYVRFAKRTKVTDYYGYKNARLGANDDVDIAEFEDVEIDTISSESAGLGGITVTTNGAVYKFGRATIRDFGDVTAANSYGISPLQGKGRINNLEIYDDRGTQIVAKAIHGINDVPLSVDNYRTNVGSRVDIRSTKMWLGNPILSSGNSPLTGHITLTAAATQTDISNNNAVSQAAGAGWAEPIIEIVPMNASAQALGQTRCTIPSNFNFRIYHAAAAGTEVFSWRVLGYAFRTVKPA